MHIRKKNEHGSFDVFVKETKIAEVDRDRFDDLYNVTFVGPAAYIGRFLSPFDNVGQIINLIIDKYPQAF